VCVCVCGGGGGVLVLTKPIFLRNAIPLARGAFRFSLDVN